MRNYARGARGRRAGARQTRSMPAAPGASGAPFGASAPAGVQHSIVYQQPRQNAATHLRARRYFF